MASVFCAVLSFGKLDGHLLHSPFESGIDWLEDAIRLLDLKATLGDDFRVNSLSHAPINPRPLKSHMWIKPKAPLIKPLNEAIKINVDAAIFDSVVGTAIIARYHDGFVLRGCAIFLDHKMDIKWAEAEALREGIILVNRFKFQREGISIFGFCLKEIFGLLESFIDVKIEWVIRSSNRVAGSLCKLAINKQCTFPFNIEYPSDIHRLVIADAC
ncbi:hypothetical protein Gohar_024589 [Gossypium harknessii]|uniref:RNase H type-1 domain-containing protein n=1 Tax=Gossypium harknessii TaxID=34285 RepID=A0A7J9HGD8_9ROSI|nr:hypothetical protein [Gossypium harknessii]